MADTVPLNEQQRFDAFVKSEQQRLYAAAKAAAEPADQVRCMIYERGKDPIEIYTVDAKAVVRQYPDRYSLKPWSDAPSLTGRLTTPTGPVPGPLTEQQRLDAAAKAAADRVAALEAQARRSPATPAPLSSDLTFLDR